MLPASTEAPGPSQASTATHQNRLQSGMGADASETGPQPSSTGVPPAVNDETETVEVAISAAIGRWPRMGLDGAYIYIYGAMVISRLRAMRSFLERVECQMQV